MEPAPEQAIEDLAAEIFSKDSSASHVLVVDGYGISLTVSRAHLILRDGLGRHRRERRLPRAQRTVRRIVILGHTGHITLEAIRWCADTGITLLQIDADGTVLLTAGPPGIDDPRIRRAQAAAATSTVGLEVTRALLTAKLDGQAAVAEQQLQAAGAAETIRTLSARLQDADSVRACRDIEADAANTYFAAWARAAPCAFAARDLAHVPDHWTSFGARTSPLHRGKTPRGAADPINALLNYGYALAEAECRTAILAVGLDPGLGIVHTDSRARDSLALDVLEPLRPIIDQHVLELLQGRHLRANDFHETRTGECRLLPPLTHALAGWMPELAQAVAPIAEQVTHAIARSSPNKIELRTPLTRARTRAAQAPPHRVLEQPGRPSAPMPTCRSCGATLFERRRKLCSSCWSVTRKELAGQRATAGIAALATARAAGSDPTHTPEAREKRRHSLIAVKAAEAAWHAQLQGPTITEQELHEVVLPRLKQCTIRQLQEATGLSESACSRIRSGKLTPHPRHWPGLTTLADKEALPAR